MTLSDLLKKAKDFLGRAGNTFNQNVAAPVQRFVQPIENKISSFANQNFVQPIQREIQQAPIQLSQLEEKIRNFGNNTIQPIQREVQRAPIQLHELFQKVQNFGKNIQAQNEQFRNKFDQSTPGIIANTISGLPKATAQTALSMAQGIARIPGSTMATFTRQNLNPANLGIVGKTIFGNEVIKPYDVQGQELAQKFGIKNPLVGAGLALGSIGLDFSNAYFPEEATAKIAVSKDAGEIAKLLKGKVADEVIPELSQVLKDVTKPEEVKSIISEARNIKSSLKPYKEKYGMSNATKGIPKVKPLQEGGKMTMEEAKASGQSDAEILVEPKYVSKISQPQGITPEAPKLTSEASVLPKSDNVPPSIPLEPKPIDLEPVLPKSKERMSVTTIANSPNVSIDTAKAIRQSPEATYEVKHRGKAGEKAQIKIFENINEAERIARTESTPEAQAITSELIKHYDTIAQKAKQAGDQAGFDAAMSKLIDISTDNFKRRTEAGRFIEAGKMINEMSPDGVMRFINGIVKKVGGKDVKFSNEDYSKIIRSAEDIKLTVDPKERALKTFELLDDIYSKVPNNEKLLDVLNIPRAIMATADFSAPLRQGLFTLAKHPITFAKNFGKMFKYAFSEKAYKNLKADIITSPNFHLYQKHKLPITDLSHKLNSKEERFMSNFVEKIPVIGKITRGSERAYIGFLNKMRVDLFDDMVAKGKQLGITDTKYLDDAAKFIGAATGRGTMPQALEKSAVALNSVFFSPRLMASRLNLLNPIYYTKLHPEVRKEALKSLLAFAGMSLGITSLAKLGGADVGTDPRNADFGKIKIGNTRYDTLGGFQQYIKLASQLITGKMISSTTGKEYTLGEGYKPTTRKDIIFRFLESKENPILSFATGLLSGQNFIGDKFKLAPEIIDRFIPMVIQDVYDIYKERGAEGLAMSIPAFFGVGMQTYGKQIPNIEKTDTGNPTIKLRGVPGLGEDIWNKITGTKVSNIPENQQQALVEEKIKEQDLAYQKEQIKKGNINNSDITEPEIQKYLKKIEKEKIKEDFINSDKSIMKVEGGYLRKSESGDTVTFISDNKYKEGIYSNQLASLKRNNNVSEWLKVAEKKLEVLQAQLNDPNTDELDRGDIQEKIDTLVERYIKYKNYGGFTKPKKIKLKKPTPIKLNLTKLDTPKPIKITSPKISMPKSLNLKQIKSPKVVIKKPTYRQSIAPSQGKRLA